MQWFDTVRFLVLLLRSDQEVLRWLVLPESSTFIHILSCLTEGAPVGPGQKQPDWSVECAISYMDDHDISACSSPTLTRPTTRQGKRHAISPGASMKRWPPSSLDGPAGLERSRRCPVRTQMGL